MFPRSNWMEEVFKLADQIAWAMQVSFDVGVAKYNENGMVSSAISPCGIPLSAQQRADSRRSFIVNEKLASLVKIAGAEYASTPVYWKDKLFGTEYKGGVRMHHMGVSVSGLDQGWDKAIASILLYGAVNAVEGQIPLALHHVGVSARSAQDRNQLQAQFAEFTGQDPLVFHRDAEEVNAHNAFYFPHLDRFGRIQDYLEVQSYLELKRQDGAVHLDFVAKPWLVTQLFQSALPSEIAGYVPTEGSEEVWFLETDGDRSLGVMVRNSFEYYQVEE